MRLLRPQIIQRKIENLDADERLMADSQIAICCFDMEELMIDSINIYSDLCRLDDNFYEFAFSEPDTYNAETAGSIRKLFDHWCNVVGRSFLLFDKMKADFMHPPSLMIRTVYMDEGLAALYHCHTIVTHCEPKKRKAAPESERPLNSQKLSNLVPQNFLSHRRLRSHWRQTQRRQRNKPAFRRLWFFF